MTGLQPFDEVPDFGFSVTQASCALVQKAGSDAVEALQQSLQATSEGVRLRAACAILEYSMKGAELLDLEARIAVLEGLPGEA